MTGSVGLGQEKDNLSSTAYSKLQYKTEKRITLLSINMWGWLGFEPMMRSCLTRATCYTAIMPAPSGGSRVRRVVERLAPWRSTP